MIHVTTIPSIPEDIHHIEPAPPFDRTPTTHPGRIFKPCFFVTREEENECREELKEREHRQTRIAALSCLRQSGRSVVFVIANLGVTPRDVQERRMLMSEKQRYRP